MRRWIPSVFGALFVLAGLLLELSLSGAVLWGELEARVYTTQLAVANLDLNCPRMLSMTETGTVSAVITNTLNEPTLPVLTATVSRVGGERRTSQTLSLAPLETQTLTWPVDSSEVLFGRVLLVNVVQSRYGDLPMRQGTCGILFFSLPGLSGAQSFYALLLLSMFCLAAGAALWLRSKWPLDEPEARRAKAWGIVVALGTAGLLAALPRWWGLILLMDVLTLIAMMAVSTEFVQFSSSAKK